IGSVRFPSAECPFFCSFTSWCSRESANENHTKPRNAVVGCLAYPDRADTAVQSQLLGTGDGDGDPRHRERCLDRGGAITRPTSLLSSPSYTSRGSARRSSAPRPCAWRWRC